MTERIWTPDSVAFVATVLYGERWQSALAADIAAALGKPFRQNRISQWYVEKGSRPIPTSLQPTITAVFRRRLDSTSVDRGKAAAMIADH
ncbi:MULTISPECIES: hypothetical protein [Hyphomicrobiales]|jgi:hypothetical protein|uniref:hypothetical protein n=1 Tax=Methylobacterium sp. CCH7-A2 TaxID=1768789 RepID=UPI00082B35B0|nr:MULTISPECIES: hypothetical protein [Hyphomicrobiales]